MKEIEAMKQLGNHPNIVGMLGYCTQSSSLCLIMDFCPLGDLRQYLLNCRHQVSDKAVNAINQTLSVNVVWSLSFAYASQGTPADMNCGIFSIWSKIFGW